MMNSSLPTWNLNDLYAGSSDENIENDRVKLRGVVEDFSSKYRGFVGKMHADGLHEMLVQYEEIEKLLAKIYVFSYLNYVTDMSLSSAKVLLQSASDMASEIAAKLTFLSIEIIGISDEKFANIVASDGKITKYLPYLRDIRKFKAHMLSEEMEGFVVQKNASGIGAVVRLFDEFESKLRFNISGKSHTLTESLDMLSRDDREVRKEAALEIARVFKENSWFYSIILNSVAKDKSLMDKYRNYAAPISSRNLANFIEDDVVECLINSVQNRYSSISHRYYKIKASLLNLPRLEFYDRNAPLAIPGSERIYTFEEAKEIVISAYKAFSPEISQIVQMFFDNNWIDARPGEAKNSGAFCCPSTSDLHPYILMNFMGKARDIATLAHELGHGVHMYLSRKQGQLMQDTPLTLAETASIFGEQLTFREMLNRTNSKEEKIKLLCGKIDDTINTVIRQIAFCQFEIAVHNKRKNSELTHEEICDIWMEIQGKSLGEYVNCPEEYRYFWVYVSHFIHSPFYVYAYAFGDLLVNSLYQAYSQGSVENFQEKYIEMLSAGGTLHHTDLLKPFNLSAKDQNFWNMGLDIIENMINELEVLM